jgi:thiol-disulfide isomerase/thioredoxin
MSYKLDNYEFIKIILILILILILLYCINTNTNTNKAIEPYKNINKINVYLFWASWCSHCVAFKPKFDDFEQQMKNSDNINIIKIQCDESTDEIQKLSDKFKIQGYPSVILENGSDFKHYNGPRTVDGLKTFVKQNESDSDSNNQEPSHMAGQEPSHVANHMAGHVAGQEPRHMANLENQEPIKVYNFNTEWCGYSRKFQPIWEDFADNVKNNMNIKAIDVKCDNDQNKDLCNKYNIQGFPTVIIVKNNQPHEYSGNRTVDDLINTINNL